MRPDLPTGSVTGQRGWQWNEWQTEGADATDRPWFDVPNRGRRQRADESVRAEVRALEVELERRERRLHHVIEHYERLLNEKDRQLADQETDETTSDDFQFVSTIRRLIAER